MRVRKKVQVGGSLQAAARRPAGFAGRFSSAPRALGTMPGIRALACLTQIKVANAARR